MSSNASSLEDEISIGDPVQVDVIPNQVNMTTTFISGTQAFWMGLSVKVNTVDRGVTLANRLRAEVDDEPSKYYQTNYCDLENNCDIKESEINGYFLFFPLQGVDPSVYATKVCQGRVVYLKPPEDGEEIINAGMLVIDSGPYTGQRIEFEAEKCYLYGFSLARADLSFLFQTSMDKYFVFHESDF